MQHAEIPHTINIYLNNTTSIAFQKQQYGVEREKRYEIISK